MAGTDSINRADAIDLLKKWSDGCVYIDIKTESAIKDFQHLPSAERKGKWIRHLWIRHFDGNEWYWYCSACKEQWYEEDLYMGGCDFPNYCPNCGAKMEGERNE